MRVCICGIRCGQALFGPGVTCAVMWECVCIVGSAVCGLGVGGKTFHIPLGSENRALCEISQSQGPGSISDLYSFGRGAEVHQSLGKSSARSSWGEYHIGGTKSGAAGRVTSADLPCLVMGHSSTEPVLLLLQPLITATISQEFTLC